VGGDRVPRRGRRRHRGPRRRQPARPRPARARVRGARRGGRGLPPRPHQPPHRAREDDDRRRARDQRRDRALRDARGGRRRRLPGDLQARPLMAHGAVPPGPTAGVVVLEDGLVLGGRSVGAPGTALGEMAFTTAMTGYQEAVTDPSYLGQILCFAAPMVGNYGTGAAQMGDGRPWPGAVLMARAGDSPGAAGPTGWATWLRANGVVGLDNVDTRRLVRRLREAGAMRGGVSTDLAPADLLEQVRAHPVLDGRDL